MLKSSHIFRFLFCFFLKYETGGWAELEDAAQHCKSNCSCHIPVTTNTNKCICLSSSTGSLNCRKIFFLSLKKNMEISWENLWNDLTENIWRSIYFAVEQSQILNGMVDSILSYFSKKPKTTSSFEIVLCIPKGRIENRKELVQMCQLKLDCPPICFYTTDSQSNEEISAWSCK